MQDTRGDCRAAAATALGQFGSVKHVSAVAARLVADADGDVCDAARKAIDQISVGGTCEEKAIAALIGNSENEKMLLAAGALDKLGIGSAEFADCLANLLQDTYFKSKRLSASLFARSFRYSSACSLASSAHALELFCESLY